MSSTSGRSVRIGGVRGLAIHFVVGDVDGVVIIPAKLPVEALLGFEECVRTEAEIRKRVFKGESLAQLYMQYERF
jgi:regulator of RNase E activity RraA